MGWAPATAPVASRFETHTAFGGVVGSGRHAVAPTASSGRKKRAFERTETRISGVPFEGGLVDWLSTSGLPSLLRPHIVVLEPQGVGVGRFRRRCATTVRNGNDPMTALCGTVPKHG